MDVVKIVYWEEDGVWLGYLQEYPDYWTQGGTLDDLKEHLRDLARSQWSDTSTGVEALEMALKRER
ncbi:MAG: type II toxin-antitoxin system HicB family antitoxin [Anaerolineae bacterium]